MGCLDGKVFLEEVSSKETSGYGVRIFKEGEQVSALVTRPMKRAFCKLLTMLNKLHNLGAFSCGITP